jgi:hypothetical protein
MRIVRASLAIFLYCPQLLQLSIDWIKTYFIIPH